MMEEECVEPSTKKRKTSRRCIVGGCSNESHHGVWIYKMPGKMPNTGDSFSSIQKQWISFVGRKRKFNTNDARNYASIVVCSGHFKKDDFKSSDVLMFEQGLRTRPPALKESAVPSVDVAHHPFPSLHVSSATAPPTTSLLDTETSASPSSSWASPSSSWSSPSSSWASPSSSCMTSFTASSVTPVTTSVICVSSSTSTFTSLTSAICTPRSSHRESTYTRKKEVTRILALHEEEESKKAEEERKKAGEEKLLEILSRSQGVQYVAQMRNQKVGTSLRPRGTRSCKLQVKIRTADKGSQKSMTEKPASTHQTVQVADASSQTVTENKVEDEEDDDEDDDFESEEIVDDEVKDPTYKPEGVALDEEIIQVTKPSDVLQEEKFIVFESNLLALFKNCIDCRASTVVTEKIRPKFFGSQLRIRATCSTCQKVWEWDSQPRVGNHFAGNVLLSSAILFGGASPTKVLRVLNHMNLQVISTRTFMEHQSTYLQPAVVRVFNREQRRLVSSIEEGEKLVLGGDGRADSPGHCAKFGSYSLMDLKRNKILDIQLVQSNEVSSSNAMEREGLERCLAKVMELGLEVGTLITDRHAQVAKWLRETYPNIDHRFDVWHIAKGIQKKITVIGKIKDCDAAQRWKRAIVNHVYWTASSTPDGDGAVMAAKYLSMFNHLQDIHVHETEVFSRCGHGDDYPEREWLRVDSKVYLKLSDELLKTRLVNAIKKMSPLGQTSSLESFHSVQLYWCPKMLAYSYPGMKCRLMIATLHWNENADRAQAVNSEGAPIFHITFPKAKEGRASVNKVLTACTFDYVDMLMGETLSLVSSKQKVRSELQELEDKPSLASRYERPDKEELIQQAQVHRRYTDTGIQES